LLPLKKPVSGRLTYYIARFFFRQAKFVNGSYGPSGLLSAESCDVQRIDRGGPLFGMAGGVTANASPC
jgi:hypothetical protein